VFSVTDHCPDHFTLPVACRTCRLSISQDVVSLVADSIAVTVPDGSSDNHINDDIVSSVDTEDFIAYENQLVDGEWHYLPVPWSDGSSTRCASPDAQAGY